jgi:DNA-binding ferritin-like protein (Dps family)
MNNGRNFLKQIVELEAQVEKTNCLKEEIITALKECQDYAWLHAHNGWAKYVYLQSVIDIVNEKFGEIKEK